MISIILPVLNEPDISTFLKELHFMMSLYDYEVLVIMGDKESLHPQIPHYENQRSLTSYGDSLERAILLGFSVAKGNKILVMDADGSHPISTISEMVKLLDTHDLIIGSRYLKDSSFEQSFFRKMISKLFIYWTRLFGSKLTDPMSGFFAIRREKLEGIKFKPYKWKVGLELSQKIGSKIGEVPINFSPRREGKSKTNWKIGLKILWDIMTG